MIPFSEIRTRLHDKEYKLTPQREFIIKVFLNKPAQHLSAEDVYQILKDSNPEIGLATVYRTLEILNSLCILDLIDFGDGISRYEITSSNAHQHHHLICTECNSISDFNEDLLETLETMINRKNGFIVYDHQVKFYGICKACQDKRQ